MASFGPHRPKYGDFFFALKRKGISPKDPDYTGHIFTWFKETVFQNQHMSCEENKWVEKFAKLFKDKIKFHLKNVNRGYQVLGDNEKIDRFLVCSMACIQYVIAV